MSHRGKLFIAALLTAACLLPSTAAAAVSQRNCRSADLRYPFMPGGPNTFGVFGLRIAHGPCTTAHRVAKAWMSKFEDTMKSGSIRRPKFVLGFTFTELPVNAAQTFRERGRKGSTSIRFDYVVPNG